MNDDLFFLLSANVFFAASVLVPRNETFKWFVLFGLGVLNLVLGIMK